eukprot:snap_masked-scaffold_38-processed-gene-1.44-mRNA-1 protein AED:1.00 eAED:1.00 QI:0/-1/0/0/-1/1/1/0/443
MRPPRSSTQGTNSLKTGFYEDNVYSTATYNKGDTFTVASVNPINSLELDLEPYGKSKESEETFSPMFDANLSKNQVSFLDDDPVLKYTKTMRISAFRLGTKSSPKTLVKRFVVGLLVILILAAATFFVIVTLEEEENVSIFPECVGEEAIVNRVLIAESLSLDEIDTLEIAGLEISCFPKNPFDKSDLDLSRVFTIRFIDVGIGIIDQDAFGELLGFEVIKLEILDESIVTNFQSQNVEFDEINIQGSEIIKFPSYISATTIKLDGMKNFEFNSNVIDFLASSPRQEIFFTDFITDDLLESFVEGLSGEEVIQIDAARGEVADFGFYRNGFSNVPDGLFSAENFEILADKVSMNIEGEPNLVQLPNNTYSGHGNNQVLISFLNCDNLVELPTSILEVNLTELDLSNTAIESLDGFDLDSLSNFERLLIGGSPLEDNCDLDVCN